MIFFSSSIFSKKIFACNITDIQKKSSGEILEVKNPNFNSFDCKEFSLIALNKMKIFNLAIAINPDDPDEITKINDITEKCSDIIKSKSLNNFKRKISEKESPNTNSVKIVNDFNKVIIKNLIHNSIEINDTFTNWNQYFENCCDILFSSFIECSGTYSDNFSEYILIFMASQTIGMLSDMLIPYILAD